MKKRSVNIKVLAVVLLLALVQSSVVAMASGAPDPADMAVYVKEGFESAVTVNGDIYVVEGNAQFKWGYGHSGTVFYRDGYSAKEPDNSPYENAIALDNTSFDAEVLDIADFPEISNAYGLYKPQSPEQVLTVSSDTHFTKIELNSSVGVSEQLIVDTSGGDVTIVVDDLAYAWGKYIKVEGAGKLIMYIENYSSTSVPLFIENGNNADKSVIVSKSLLKFGEASDPDFYVRVFYVGVNSLTHHGKFIGSLATDAESLTISGGSHNISGVVYAPNADITFSSSAKLYGRLVGKSIKMTGGADSTFIEYDASASLNVPDAILEGGSQDPGSGSGPDGYKNGILGTYYDSYEPTNQAKKLARIDSNIAFNYGYTEYPHESMARENFSIIWEGFFRAPETGSYVFRTFSDDGVKLSVGGTQIINNWGLYSLDYLTSSAVTLTQGELYPIQLDYQQGPLFAAVYLFWEYNGVNMGLVPNEHLFVEQATYDSFNPAKTYNESLELKKGSGFSNRFYPMLDVEEIPSGQPTHEEVNNIDYNWGTGAPEGIESDMFYGVMEGWLEAPVTGEITLIFTVDDALNVWVDDIPVIEQWSYNSAKTFTHTLSVNLGIKHKIKVEFADFHLLARLHMEWEGVGLNKEAVPRMYMYSTN